MPLTPDLRSLREELERLTDNKKASFLQRFFKTGKGEYGEGDIFVGLTVPQSRILAVKYKDLSFLEILELLKSKIHEERLIALLILVHRFKKNPDEQKKIYDFYLKNTKCVNNWDLVDLSSHHIIGEYLLDKPKDKEDLIQKALGWMLREIGKKDLETEETFLKKYYKQMGRTALRYAIEKFPEGKRLKYLHGEI